MKPEWDSVVITKIAGAIYVPPNTGRHAHKNRPFHGFVVNESGCVRDYCFSDGSILHVGENDLFYLPRGSSYDVKHILGGGCYAINFAAEIADEPFSINLKSSEHLKKSFKRACREWQSRTASRDAYAMCALYEAVGFFLDAREPQYLSSMTHERIAPALNLIEQDFSDASLTVERLAALCGMSEVYLRKIFLNRFGVSPKEYILQKRMDYACHLLSSGQFEVCEVARLCGYTEPCHFSREFKKRMGICPKDYM